MVFFSPSLLVKLVFNQNNYQYPFIFLSSLEVDYLSLTRRFVWKCTKLYNVNFYSIIGFRIFGLKVVKVYTPIVYLCCIYKKSMNFFCFYAFFSFLIWLWSMMNIIKIKFIAVFFQVVVYKKNKYLKYSSYY